MNVSWADPLQSSRVSSTEEEGRVGERDGGRVREERLTKHHRK